jgi:TPP-dependent pyruvate/acetoin dehydrogenase alpha subunit
MRGTDQVVLSFLGDGASNRGTFHEGVNLASCWKLPLVYIVENNMYAEKTRITDTCRLANVSDRSKAYDIPGLTVDGNDVMAVHEAAGEAVARARRGEGPTILECKTYRIHGHYEGDPQTYKPDEEVAYWKSRDPILSFKARLLEMKVFTDEDVASIDLEVGQEIEDAVRFAQESAFPDPEETLEDVFA